VSASDTHMHCACCMCMYGTPCSARDPHGRGRQPCTPCSSRPRPACTTGTCRGSKGCAWYNAISAVATTQTVLGDKAHGARTKQFNDFNDGHVVDIAETDRVLCTGDSGVDTCVEVSLKAFSSLTKSGGTGRGGVNGGTTAAVGHKYGFGNTEEPCRVANLGCKPRDRHSARATDPSITTPARGG
jgi:hypothetical protein